MIPAPSYEYIEKILNEDYFQLLHGFARGLPSKSKTVGFILIDQNFNRGTIQDFLGNLDMINLHSGSNIHFFMCGISQYGPNNDGARRIGSLNNIELYHNAAAAFSFVQAFEKNIPGWNYDLGFELILIDLKIVDKKKILDFNSAVYFKIEELIKLKIIDRPSDLFGKIVKFVHNGKFDGASAFRDEFKAAFGMNWFKAFILAMFPKSVAQLARAQAVLAGGAAVPE